ncbi:hypothetical protein [Ruegeria sp.]|uniref:hypothetical protein n=1 Tax=Ruegeria sp. TaxID=1879320 RepID=UPI003B00153B
MNMGEEVSHLKAHVNTFYNNGALQRASEQPHLKTNQKPSQINKKVGSQETAITAAGNRFTQNITDFDHFTCPIADRARRTPHAAAPMAAPFGRLIFLVW